MPISEHFETTESKWHQLVEGEGPVMSCSGHLEAEWKQETEVYDQSPGIVKGSWRLPLFYRKLKKKKNLLTAVFYSKLTVASEAA